MLTFQQEGHVYRYNGVVTPSVTQVLAPLTDLSRIPTRALENARQEGIDQHRLVELEMRNNLDEASLPLWLKPRLVGLRKFVADTGFVMLASEEMMYSEHFQVAGTPDLVGPFRTRPSCALIDVKRSLLGGRVVGLQLSGYALMWNELHPDNPITERYALVLKDNDYRLEPFTDPRDRSVFLAALTMHKWLQNGK